MLKQIAEILKLKNDLREEQKLPGRCAFLDERHILAYPHPDGNARYPYMYDGRVLWAYSNGEIVMQEGTFNIFPDTTGGREPACAFFVGEKQENSFSPISVTGVAQHMGDCAERFVVYTPKAAFYFLKTKKLLTVLRIFIDDQKRTFFTFYIENSSDNALDAYLSAYFNPLLTHGSAEGFWDKGYRCGRIDSDGFLINAVGFDDGRRIDHYARIVSAAPARCKTTSRIVLNGGVSRQLSDALSLMSGKLERYKPVTAFSETAVAAEICPFSLGSGESRIWNYCLIVSDRAEQCPARYDVEDIFEKSAVCTGRERSMPVISVNDAEGPFGRFDRVISPFLNNVVRQVEFCTQAKNYAGNMVGMRDIFQQIEGAVLTSPEDCRRKIVEALNFIGEDGRVPRQYSYPKAEGALPAMDLREYVDQGVWIISTVFTYLNSTEDESISDEICGYYAFHGNSVDFSSRRDDVFSHLTAIADYLISKIDPKTHCLRALYGDWNDALDGLGQTEKNCEFGSGVSVMATLQLYKNLGELVEIMHRSDRDAERAARYLAEREQIRRGLVRYAVLTCPDGSRKIVHGWGDDRSFFVGSDCDGDGVSRDGLTSNAFWVLCGMLNDSDAVKKADILKAYDRLDSKYGLKTFEPYFPASFTKVGRISRLPKGTAENGAVYIHATLFAVQSLFMMGETARAWDQLYKVLPFTHERISTSPFVMSNSYAYNPELDLDGQSISDWFTGSGCVLLKVIYRQIFGINPVFGGVRICPAQGLPFRKASLSVIVKGKSLTVNLYRGDHAGMRKFVFAGKEYFGESLFLENERLSDGCVVEIST